MKGLYMVRRAYPPTFASTGIAQMEYGCQNTQDGLDLFRCEGQVIKSLKDKCPGLCCSLFVIRLQESHRTD